MNEKASTSKILILIVSIFLLAIILFAFNIFLMFKTDCGETKGYGAIVGIPLYSAISTGLSMTTYVVMYFLLKKILKIDCRIIILIAVIFSILTSLAYMNFFICNDSFYIHDYI